MHRWHIMDPVRFGPDRRVTIQALGWRPDRANLNAQYLTKVMLDRLGGGRRPATHYLPLQDDIASTAVLVPDGAARAVRGASGAREAGGDLTAPALRNVG